MKALFFLFVFTLPFYGFSQPAEIKGKVVDAETGLPLDLATIEVPLLRTGCYSNQQGEFTLALPENNPDAVAIVSFLGYAPSSFTLSEWSRRASDAVIALTPAPIALDAVVVKPQKTTAKTLGVTTNKPWRYQVGNVFGGQGGQYLPNTTKKEGLIKSVSFYIMGIGRPDAPFRVRIYRFDPATNTPGEDLLRESVIVAGAGKEGWLSVDISQYGVGFPLEGVVVCRELIDAGDQYYYDYTLPEKPDAGSIKGYGITIGSVYKQKKAGFFARRGLGHPWGLLDDYYKGYINLMINAEVLFPK